MQLLLLNRCAGNHRVYMISLLRHSLRHVPEGNLVLRIYCREKTLKYTAANLPLILVPGTHASFIICTRNKKDPLSS